MTLSLLIFLAVLGALAGAVAVWLSKKLDVGWTARERVFNSAAIIPTIIVVGGVCFTLVALTLAGRDHLTGTKLIAIQLLTATLASFDGGLIGAYLVERISRK